jgi:hypothetical protein
MRPDPYVWTRTDCDEYLIGMSRWVRVCWRLSSSRFEGPVSPNWAPVTWQESRQYAVTDAMAPRV